MAIKIERASEVPVGEDVRLRQSRGGGLEGEELGLEEKMRLRSQGPDPTGSVRVCALAMSHGGP